jgi:hypothetical protein
MSDLLQHGHHPDADQLIAFAERAMPEHERRETLAHLANCPDCRQIVFLAQQAAGSPTPLPHALPVRRGWLRNWHNLWPLAAALACGLIVTAFVHHRQSADLPKQSESASISNAPLPSTRPTLSAPVVSAPQPFPKMSAPAKLPLARHPAPATARAGVPGMSSVHGDLVANGATSPSQFRPGEFASSQQSSADAVAASPHALGGAVGGPIALGPPSLRQKDALPTATPMAAGQAQTVEVQPENRLLSQRSVVSLARSESRQTDAQHGVSQTVTVNGAAPLVQTESAVLSTSSFSGNATLAKSSKAPLPSRKPAASTISNGQETLAVDTEGDLFLSKDPSIAWQRVTRQWTGKAVKVSLAEPSSTMQADVNASAGSSNVEAIRPKSKTKKAVFELTTDTGTTWSSPDGLIWKQP